jgi:hypothetical protein
VYLRPSCLARFFVEIQWCSVLSFFFFFTRQKSERFWRAAMGYICCTGAGSIKFESDFVMGLSSYFVPDLKPSPVTQEGSAHDGPS